MQLTTQMLVEIGTIKTRVYDIADAIIKPMVFESSKLELNQPGSQGVETTSLWLETRDRQIRAIIAELSPYKVRLENILCETDIKEQAHSH